MKVLLSWVREFVDLDESAEAIGRKLSLRGLALEGLEPAGTDALLDFDVTANRPDCMSVAGIAREVAVARSAWRSARPPIGSPRSWPPYGATGLQPRRPPSRSRGY